MHILFIGGSNFVIRDGLSQRLPEDLALLSGRVVTRVDNLSVGGTTSMSGLHRLLGFDDGHSVDFAFVEYGINDLPFHRRNANLWRSTFVALLDATRQRCPRAQVVVIVLGRRDKKTAEAQADLHADIRQAAASLGVRLVDADAVLRSARFDGLPFSAHYIDGEHFESPRAVAYLSILTAAQALLPLPTGLTEAAADAAAQLWFRADALAVHDLAAGLHGVPTREFRNSRFVLPTAVCSAGVDIVIDLPGEPCGLVFASAADSGSLRIDVDGRVSILHTLHKPVAEGRFPFLIRHAPFYWLTRSEVRAPGRRRLRLSLTDTAGLSAGEPVRPAFNMVASTRPLSEQRVYVSSVMSLTTPSRNTGFEPTRLLRRLLRWRAVRK